MYSPDQIGDIDIRSINLRTIDQFSLILIQPDNEQLLIMEPCSWPKVAQRVKDMISRGVDPFDIRFTMRQRDQIETDGLPLKHLNEGLFWTLRDFKRAVAEKSLNEEAIRLSKRYFEMAE